VREPAPPDADEGEDRLKRKVRAETKRLDRRLGRALQLRETNDMERRMKKSMEGGKEGKRRDDA